MGRGTTDMVAPEEEVMVGVGIVLTGGHKVHFLRGVGLVLTTAEAVAAAQSMISTMVQLMTRIGVLNMEDTAGIYFNPEGFEL